MNRRVAAHMSLSVFVVASTSSCGRSEPPSPIVQFVEQAGAGDLSGASGSSIHDWLGKHRDVADQTDTLCQPVRQRASATWGDSTEGRVCGAAHELAFFRSAPAKGDGRTFRPGLN
jgi:hypothetical protein